MTDQVAIISLNNRSNIHINSILCKILWYGENQNTEEITEEADE